MVSRYVVCVGADIELDDDIVRVGECDDHCCDPDSCNYQLDVV